MKRILFAAVLFIALHASATAKTSFHFAGSTVELLDSAEAAVLNGASDAYTRALTPFDLAIRLDKANGATETGLFARAAAAVRSWSEKDAQDLRTAFGDVERGMQLHRIGLPLPAVIQMVKTDGSEEFGAEGYTRGTRIMLNVGAEPPSAHIVAHELFHVLSRANIALRDRVYAVFGFKSCAPIAVSAALNGRSVTNPDCPVVEHFVAVPDGKVLRFYTLVLYSRVDYKVGGTMGDYAAIGLLELAGVGREKTARFEDGKAVVREPNDVPAFFDIVGKNTQYLLHPEEISAEHFAMLLTGKERVREPKYLEGVKAALK